MFKVRNVMAREILDSRGRPTVEATLALDDGISATASVPSGRSTGTAEALELRDGDAERYRGLGCQKAVANVETVIAGDLKHRAFAGQAELDRALIELDGTPNKAHLGANGILAVSLAFARACAMSRGTPLYRHLNGMIKDDIGSFPRLTINLFSGGKHAGRQVAIQDVLIVPSRAETVDASLVVMYDIYQAAAELALERYGMRLLTADEGGLAPPFADAEAMLDAAIDAIERAGYTPGHDVHLAVDVASSHFHRDGMYHIGGTPLTGAEMIERLVRWVDRYPIVSLEDGLHEDDWEHWPRMCEAIGDRVLVLGDDLLCTHPERIERAVRERSCNGLLLKVNQVGTLTEAAASYELARNAGWLVTISVRSGETEDNWAADLAVGWAGDQFKNGSITQSERLAKYNRLLAIENENPLPIRTWPYRRPV